MGEVVVSCEEAMDAVVVVQEERENEEKRANNEDSSSISMMRWDRLLPRTALRVLLVEADDSTRQIIGALLRKCNYKVASVADGLKAWEVLKVRHDSIDLILTEVELPAISGYALLTLISEHEVCKNIPVIMMSKHDSVSMVYKCMLRGAADFLVKPIRINELKNLWQHVWRRQSINREGRGPQEERYKQQNLEATAENTAASDHSSSSKTCALPGREECIKKRSDAQSSSSNPDVEGKNNYKAGGRDHLQTQQGECPVSDSKIQEQSNLCPPESALTITAASNDNDVLDGDGRVEQQNHVQNLNLYPEAGDDRDNHPPNPSVEAINLIGAFDNHSNRRNSCSNGGTDQFDRSPQLDLSLRRFLPGAFLENRSIHEKQNLNHSNGSAFTRYVSKTLYTPNSKANSGSRIEKATSADHIFGNIPGSNPTANGNLLTNERNTMSLANEAENHASLGLFPIPVPVRGVRVDVRASPAGYGPTVSPRVCSPSSLSPCQRNQQMNSVHQFNIEVINGIPQYHLLDQSPRISSNQSSKQDQLLESSEDWNNLSPPADQSASSTLCNGFVARHVNGLGNNVNIHQDAMASGGSDSGNGQLQRQKSIQREAALTKFRLKRKERCFEKKVRYESRKKLAEQRPRVKGQFVRQVLPDPLPPKSEFFGQVSC